MFLSRNIICHLKNCFVQIIFCQYFVSDFLQEFKRLMHSKVADILEKHHE